MKQIIMISGLILICVIGFYTMSGCDKRPEPLDRKTIRMIDTLAAKEIKKLRVELDSICSENFDTYVQLYVDSILETRIKEIKALIE